MRPFFLIAVFLLVNSFAIAQTSNKNYDSSLAKTLGADDYGMKMYVFVVLKTGGNISENKATTDSLFAGHMKNIHHLVDLKKLIVAGPFAKNENNFRGLFILDVASFEEANKLLEMDPAIKADLLKAELYKWYGSAALPQYLPYVDKITKTNP